MKCPYCAQIGSTVVDSREAEDQATIRRRRECVSCQKRFTTYERIEGIDLKVLKKDGEREPFSREKLRRGIVKATWKRPVSMADVDALIDDVECTLRRHESSEVKSWQIGNLVLERLRELDPLSYVLFASVYRDFSSLDDFKAEIDALTLKKITQDN